MIKSVIFNSFLKKSQKHLHQNIKVQAWFTPGRTPILQLHKSSHVYQIYISNHKFNYANYQFQTK